MVQAEVQFPDPLYQRLKEIATQQDWSFSEVMRRAAENFVSRFPSGPETTGKWKFPVLDCGGDFLTDPASISPEAEAAEERLES